jgi:N-acetylglutamate synthase/N-acetylornithine aminotransferase
MLQHDSILPAALAITTTDRYAKVRSILSRSKKWRVVGIAKGAGMIEPNMAVCISYVNTFSVEFCFEFCFVYFNADYAWLYCY